MSDDKTLVARLRAGVKRLANTRMDLALSKWIETSATFLEAAARIEALEAENFALAANQCKHGLSGEHGDHICSRIEALEEALRWIKNMPLPAPPLDDPAHNMRTIATRALGDGQ